MLCVYIGVSDSDIEMRGVCVNVSVVVCVLFNVGGFYRQVFGVCNCGCLLLIGVYSCGCILVINVCRRLI